MKALADWLEHTGTSQAALAGDCKVSQATISNLVNRVNGASNKLLKRISTRTGLSIDVLLAEDASSSLPSNSSDHAA